MRGWILIDPSLSRFVQLVRLPEGLIEDLGWCHPAEGLSRARVEFVSEGVEMRLVVDSQDPVDPG